MEGDKGEGDLMIFHSLPLTLTLFPQGKKVYFGKTYLLRSNYYFKNFS